MLLRLISRYTFVVFLDQRQEKKAIEKIAEIKTKKNII